MIKHIWLSAVLIIFTLSCKDDKPTNLSDAKQAVKEYYESGKFDEEIKLVVDEAIEKLKNIKFNENSTVVFDIDETALSGYDYALQLDFGYEWNSWTEWQLKAEAPPIKEVKRLYDYLVDKNINIVFLTGKRDITYESTYKNLIEAGYTKFDTLICRSEEEYKLKAEEYKTYHRKKLTETGLEIIMCVGDQKSDLEGKYTGIKVKIPNYLYTIH
jgi:predicted secreted acid phosphatase